MVKKFNRRQTQIVYLKCHMQLYIPDSILECDCFMTRLTQFLCVCFMSKEFNGFGETSKIEVI